jgi:hypothetical protein
MQEISVATIIVITAVFPARYRFNDALGRALDALGYSG